MFSLLGLTPCVISPVQWFLCFKTLGLVYFYLHVNLCVCTCVCRPHGGQKRAWDSLEDGLLVLGTASSLQKGQQVL